MSKIVHIEIPAPDLEKAKEFYSKLFNWKVEYSGMDYTLWFPAEEGVAGGFSKSAKPSTEGVLLHIGVDDIKAKLAEIEVAGGKTVTPKTKISDEWGYYAEFLDVFGNKLGLWSEK
ncbi:MAG: VOC family protein [candidate division WOR-3 bacterium]|nr:VOC family protein [candidate division WOR-3 bacterium]